MKKILLVTLLLASFSAHPLRAETVHLKRILTGGSALTGGQQPVRLFLTQTPPAQLKKLPDHLVNPSYGLLNLGALDASTGFIVIVDDRGETVPAISIQPASGGSLIEVIPSQWKDFGYKGADGTSYIRHEAAVTLEVRYGKISLPETLVFLVFDPEDPSRRLLRGSIMYYTDTASEGQITLGKTQYRCMLKDLLSRADFHGHLKEPVSGVLLMIDVNENGFFDHKGEIFDIAQPFNIKGITYEVAQISSDGETLEFVHSDRKAVEIAPPPDLRIGHRVPSFEAKTIEGKIVHFPEDYKGKKVLLQFWASWCSDCQKEMPNLAANYAKYHPMGLETLGISVDKPDTLNAVKEYMQAIKMTWPQVYEGKHWQSSIAVLYDCRNIPGAILVDGTTGEVLAISDDVLAARLDTTLQKYFSK